MREFFKSHGFSPASRKLIVHCQQIVQRYQAQGLRMTLRQLYYQLVSANIIRNEEKQYKRMSSLLSKARLMGLIDWSAIEDRIRVPRMPTEFEDLDELVDAALNSFRLPRWADQPRYVELWVEKDALAGILRPLGHEYHVPIMVNRGYSSQSAMYDAGKRFLTAMHGGKLPYTTMADELREEKEVDPEVLKEWAKVSFLSRSKIKSKRELVLLYLGDMDPSGEDMVRDIQERLMLFGARLEVRKIALTREQVEEHDPPPNPAKMTDPRAAQYVAEHGDMSWEVDALPPDVLNAVIREHLDELVDEELMEAVKEREDKDRELLRKAVASVRKKGKNGKSGTSGKSGKKGK